MTRGGAALAILLGACAATGVERLDRSRVGGDTIDATVVRLMTAAHVPGLALAIVSDGKVVHLKGYGFRDLAKREPMTPDTVMVGASFTKAAFAFAVMQLVEEGVLDLDKPVAEYLGRPLAEDEDYRDLAGDERAERITARMLLSHTSGFPNWRRFNDGKKLDIKADPGTRYMYSGEGIVLLQGVVRKLTGKPTADLMRERVFAPLGMSRTSMVWQPQLEAETATGYDTGGQPLGHAHRKSADAAGSMDTTARDWARFLDAVLRGERLGRAAREEMLRPQIRIRSRRQFPTASTETTDQYDAIGLSYGLGWGLYSCQYGKAYFKEGHDDGWQNYSVTFEDAKIAVVIMTNSDNGESMFKELLASVIGDTCLPWEWENYIPFDGIAAVRASL